MINVYDDVIELEERYGIVLEKGGVDMERYLKFNYSHISEVHKLFSNNCEIHPSIEHGVGWIVNFPML